MVPIRSLTCSYPAGSTRSGGFSISSALLIYRMNLLANGTLFSYLAVARNNVHDIVNG